MRGQRGDDNRLGIGPHDGAACRERVRRRARGRRQDHAVRSVGRHFLAVHHEREVHRVGDVRVHNDGLIERPVRGLGTVRALHRDIQRHAPFHREVALRDLARQVARARRAELRQEAHVPGVDAEQGHAQRTRARGGHQKGAVAADRQHHVDAARGRVLDDLNAVFGQRMRQCHSAGHGVRSVAVTHHEDTCHDFLPAGPSATARRM